MRKDFNEHHMMQVPFTENQLGAKKMMKEVPERVVRIYPEIPECRFVALTVDDFLFPWEQQMGTYGNLFTIDEDEGFFETMP